VELTEKLKNKLRKNKRKQFKASSLKELIFFL
jgi:hypothetical protein